MMELGIWFQWLMRSTLQVSLLVFIVLAVKTVLRTRLAPRWHYCLWLLVVVRMLMPSAPQSSLSVFNLIGGPIERVTSAPVAETGLDETFAAEAALVAQRPLRVETEQQAPQAVAPATEQDTASFTFPPLVQILPMLWLGGAIVLAIYVFAGNFRLWSIVKCKRPVTDSGVLDLLEDCKGQMNIHTPLAVVETDRIASPALFGFLRPRLLLPEGMLGALDRSQLRHILLHELAHLKRGDIYLGWLVAILQTVHWFNPIVWFGFHRMRSDRELACDNLALSAMGAEEPAEYGRTIVKLLENFSTPKYTPSLAGILEERSQLKRRINMIAKFKKGSYKFSAMAAILFTILSVVALTNARTRTPSGSAIVDNMPPNLYQNLVLYYSFDKGNEETVIDMSGKGNDGVVHGAAYTQDGVSGKAMTFDGRYTINDQGWEGQYIDAGDDLSIQAEIFTVAAWIKTNDTDRKWQTILSYEKGSHAISIFKGKIHYGWQDVKFGQTGTTDVRTGQWVFVAVTRDHNNKASIYVNGKLENSFICDTFSKFTRRAKIGGDTIDGEFFHGSIDEVAIFNRALSTDEVKQLYAGAETPDVAAEQTYIVEFKAVPPFAPQTPRELLNAFNENHPRNVHTHHYWTVALDNELLGFICVDRESGNDAVASMLKESGKLDFINSTPATEEDLEKLYARRQESLGNEQKQTANIPMSGRRWGPEQTTGAPNTHRAGDIVTAWASRSQDEQKEWLILEYAKSVFAAQIDIYETFNPGAVYKVSVFTKDGKEVEAWEGTDPTAVGSGKGVSKIPVGVDFKTSKIKIYLDSPSVRGWNEIDAVGLVDNSGKTQWAVSAEASSTYAETGKRTSVIPVFKQVEIAENVENLEDISVSPASGSVMPLISEIEVVFNQPMIPDLGKIVDATKNKDPFGFSLTRVSAYYGNITYDPKQHKFTIPLLLPPDWNGTIQLRQFRTAKGAKVDPFTIDYSTSGERYSAELQKRFQQAKKSEKLRSILDKVKEARENITSLSETVHTVHKIGNRDNISKSIFKFQGKKQFYADVSEIMKTPFYVGSDGKDCWQYNGREGKEKLVTAPFNEIAQKNVLICDLFEVTQKGVSKIIESRNIEYLGTDTFENRKHHLVRLWQSKKYGKGHISSVVHTAWIDVETYMISQMISDHGGSIMSSRFVYDQINKPIPDSEFSPARITDIERSSPRELDDGHDIRFINAIDGSNGRKSVRWGERGSGGTISSGLN